MKLFTAAAIMAISSSVLSLLPATVSASKGGRGGKTSKAKAAKIAYSSSLSSSYSMSVDPRDRCFPDIRYNCMPFKQGTKNCNELTNGCKFSAFRLGCKEGPLKPAKEVCPLNCNPACTILGKNPCVDAPNYDCYPSNNGRPMCCNATPDGSSCSRDNPEPCETLPTAPELV